MKDDEVVSGIPFDDNDEYIAIFTNRNTAKRIKLSELNSLSRAKRGSTLIKKVKSTPYEVINAFITNKSENIGIVGEDINIIKSTDISIMDEVSTGSNYTKETVRYVFRDLGLIEISEEVIEIPKMKKDEPKEMTIDDFINDFKI